MSEVALTVPVVADLTDRERDLLAFEKLEWKHRGAKDDAIRKTFGLSPWQYSQRLLALCEQPAALAAEPVLVNRVRRLQHFRRHRPG